MQKCTKNRLPLVFTDDQITYLGIQKVLSGPS